MKKQIQEAVTFIKAKREEAITLANDIVVDAEVHALVVQKGFTANTDPVGYMVVQKKEWVGLTDEEIMSVAYQAGFDIHEDYGTPDADTNELHWWLPDYERCDDVLFKLRDLIEAKLKDRNT